MYVYIVWGREKERTERKKRERDRDRETETGCHHMHEEVRGHLTGIRISIRHIFSRDRTPDVRLDSKYLCLLNRLTGPEKELSF